MGRAQAGVRRCCRAARRPQQHTGGLMRSTAPAGGCDSAAGCCNWHSTYVHNQTHVTLLHVTCYTQTGHELQDGHAGHHGTGLPGEVDSDSRLLSARRPCACWVNCLLSRASHCSMSSTRMPSTLFRLKHAPAARRPAAAATARCRRWPPWGGGPWARPFGRCPSPLVRPPRSPPATSLLAPAGAPASDPALGPYGAPPPLTRFPGVLQRSSRSHDC